MYYIGTLAEWCGTDFWMSASNLCTSVDNLDIDDSIEEGYDSNPCRYADILVRHKHGVTRGMGFVAVP